MTMSSRTTLAATVVGLSVALSLWTSPLLAQSASNAVYFELLGSAVVPSFNYEHRLRESWYGRAGFSVVTSESDTDSDTTWVVPFTLSWVRHPERSHHLELGGGLTAVFGDEQDWSDFEDEEGDFSQVVVTGIVGYRYQKPEGGFQFRAVVTPVAGSFGVDPWMGVSFGYAW